MAKWILKALVQKTISYLPYSEQVNRWFQQHVTRGLRLDEVHFSYKFEHLLDHLYFYQQATGRADLSQQQCLELGTGWYPIIPIGYFLRGAQRTLSVDIAPHMTSHTFLTCIREVLSREEAFIHALGNEVQPRFDRLKAIQTESTPHTPLLELCNRINLEIRVADARKLPFPNDHFALITSNNTYEHIYPTVLSAIVPELWRTLKPGGLMSHFIDMSDHFAHMDPSITIYNFLQFSDRAWAWIDNNIQPQNRWRLKDYMAMYEAVGIPYEAARLRPGNLTDLRSVKLHPRYQHYSPEELAISHGYLVSRK